jgi:hypothetical protein
MSTAALLPLTLTWVFLLAATPQPDSATDDTAAEPSPAPSLAPPSPPAGDAPDPKARAEARRLRDAAYRRLLDDDYASGIAQLEAAYERVPNPGLLLNVVIAYRRWPGHCTEAYAAHRRFETACGPDCEFHRDGAEQLAALDAKCRAPVTFIAHEPTALFVDDRAIGRTPQTVRLRPGVHRVQTSTGADFSIDVEPETPQVVLLPSALTPRPERERVRPRDALTFGLAGLGAGAAILGGTFTGLAIDAASTLDGARAAGAAPGELDRLAERQDRDAAVAVVGWSVAAASGAAAVALWLTRDPPARLGAGPADSGSIARAGDVELGLGTVRVRF